MYFFKVNAIDCFVCNSINGSNSYCEDPFNTNVIKYLRKNCEGYKKERQGNFPADHCIKIVGTAGNFPHTPLAPMLHLKSIKNLKSVFQFKKMMTPP